MQAQTLLCIAHLSQSSLSLPSPTTTLLHTCFPPQYMPSSSSCPCCTTLLSDGLTRCSATLVAIAHACRAHELAYDASYQRYKDAADAAAHLSGSPSSVAVRCGFSHWHPSTSAARTCAHTCRLSDWRWSCERNMIGSSLGIVSPLLNQGVID